MDRLHLDQHISRQYSEELEDLRNKMLAMGEFTRAQLRGSLAALFAGDVNLARELDRQDDQLDDFERSIDADCQRILAQRQPAATDLRLVISVLKTITDFERMGDETQKLARMTLRRADHEVGALPEADSLAALGKRVGTMVDDMLTALARLDAYQAVAVCREDAAVDEGCKALLQSSLPSLARDPANALDLVWAARALERVGDHACNICEYLIYLLGGEDVRHVSLTDMQDAARKAEGR